ncbi:MAG: hypothetical protein M1820_010307 [Bogoriella megaspora]|nr:MAG: hypothetical protein M1820_010307 [Bogoriella megaspora]
MASTQTIVLITGGNSGVGYECAKNLLQTSSTHHIIIGSRDPSKGSAAVTSLQTLPDIKGTVSTVQIDVTDDSSISTAAQTIHSTHHKLDILVNNAGTISHLPTARDRLRSTLATNTIGAVAVTEIFTPLLRASPDPRVIFVTSSMGSISGASDPKSKYYTTVTGEQQTEYRASKAALNMLMVQYGKEPHGFKTWGADPGLNVTGLLGGLKMEGVDEVEGGRISTPDVGGAVIAGCVKGGRDGEVGRVVGRYEGVGLW